VSILVQHKQCFQYISFSRILGILSVKVINKEASPEPAAPTKVFKDPFLMCRLILLNVHLSLFFEHPVSTEIVILIDQDMEIDGVGSINELLKVTNFSLSAGNDNE